MSGDISPDDSADDGRGGSQKRTKGQKRQSFVVFALFASRGFIIERLIFQMYPGISPI